MQAIDIIKWVVFGYVHDILSPNYILQVTVHRSDAKPKKKKNKTRNSSFVQDTRRSDNRAILEVLLPELKLDLLCRSP